MVESTKAESSWAERIQGEVNQLTGLSTSSAVKYDTFKQWLTDELEVDPAVCYLSDPSKQWTARVGQALMGMPSLLVLLIEGRADDSLNARLTRLHSYVTGLEATLVVEGSEGQWQVARVSGVPGARAFDLLRRPPAVEDATETMSPPRRQPRTAHSEWRFFELEPEEQAVLAWTHLLGYGSLPVAHAVRIAAEALRTDGHIDYARLRSDGLVYSELESAIAYASRRGILFDRPNRGEVRAFKADAEDYTRADWRICILESLSADEWTDRDTAVRNAAQYAVAHWGLGMMRLRAGGRVDAAIRSAISGLLRTGYIERDGRELIRKAVTPTPSLRAARQATPPEDEEKESAEVRPTAAELRRLLGHIPFECETTFTRLLDAPLEGPASLSNRVHEHLATFEAAFDQEQFLDVGGARRLASEAEGLLAQWSELSLTQRALAQAAILYFVESSDADDDFAINGLRTDKAIFAAVQEALL